MAAESDEIISVNSNNKNNSLTTINGKIESVNTNKNVNNNNNNNSRERVNNIINSNNNNGNNNDNYNLQHNNDNDVEDEVASAITNQIHINNRRRENPPPNYYSELSEHRTVHVDGHDDGLGPLPIKWEKAYTESGEVYFIDHNTGTSHWLDPRLSKFQKKSLEDCLDDELPYGWEKIHDPQYGTYFIDHVNRRTQYENPVLEAKRRAESNIHNNNNNGNTNMGNKSLKIKSSSLGNVDRDKNGSSTTAITSIFTRNPSELCGERITTTLLKSSRGLGFTIVGADDDNIEEFLQIKLIVPNGPAWLDGKLKTGDILVYVNDICVLGFSHHEMVNVFQSIMSGETVTLEICRGYPLPFDPNDPNTDIVTTIAVDGLNTLPHMDIDTINRKKMDGNYNFLDISDPIQQQQQQQQQKNPLSKIHSGLVNNNNNNNNNNNINENNLKLDNNNILSICIVKGIMGFGFTIADSVNGQKVKKILDRQCCKNLIEGDLLLQINKVIVKNMSHSDVVQVLKDCPKNQEAVLKVQRFVYFNHNNSNNNNNENKKKLINNNNNKLNDNNNILNNKNKIKDNLLYRSKTPTADLYSTQQKEILPIRPKTPLIDTRLHTKTPSIELIPENNDDLILNDNKQLQQQQQQQQLDTKSINSYPDHDSINNDSQIFPKNLLNITERLKDTMLSDNDINYEQQQQFHQHLQQQQQQHHLQQQQQHHQQQQKINRDFYNYKQQQHHQLQLQILAPVPTYHQDSCFCYECQDYTRNQHQHQQQHEYSANVNIMQPIPHHVYQQYGQHQPQHINNRMGKKVNEYLADRKKSVFSPLENPHNQILLSSATSPPYWTTYGYGQQLSPNSNLSQQHDEYILSEVTLERQSLGFGFRIVGGTEEGSQVTVGHIVPGGSADSDPRITTGDEILSIDGVSVVNSSHHRVVQLMGEAGIRGQVTMILRRKKHSMHSMASPPLPPALPQMNSMPIYYQQQQQQQQMIGYPYDVIVSRNENEGFGFVIISSSSQFYGSTIGKLIPGSPADRCGELKVGDRIIAVNRIDIAGMSHGDVVNLIKESGLHVRLSIGAPSQHQQSQQQPPLPPPPQLSLTPNNEPLLTGIAALQHQQNQTYSNQSQQQQHPPPQL